MNINFLLNDKKREQFSCAAGLILEIIILLILTNIFIFHKPKSMEKVRVVIQSPRPMVEINQKVEFDVESNQIESEPKISSTEAEQKVEGDYPMLESKAAEKVGHVEEVTPVPKKVVTRQETNKPRPKPQIKQSESELARLEALLKAQKKVKVEPPQSESQYKINVFDRNVPINKETIKSKEETFAKPSVINRYNKVKSSDDIKSAEHTTKPDNNINQPVYNVGRQSSAEKPVFNDNIFVSGSGIKSDNINISNTQGADNYSARTPGILTSPPLDATDLLKKGEFYIIRFHGVIDGGGFLKELTVIKTSGFLRLDTIAKQHIMNNWRWTPGFDNAEVAIELRVEKKI